MSRWVHWLICKEKVYLLLQAEAVFLWNADAEFKSFFISSFSIKADHWHLMFIRTLEFLLQQCFLWLTCLSKICLKSVLFRRVKYLHNWFLFKNKQKNYFCNGFPYFQVFVCSLLTHLERMFEEASLNLISRLQFYKAVFSRIWGA